MRLHRAIAVLTGLALVLTTAQPASAQSTAHRDCASAVPQEVRDQRKSALEENDDLQRMLEALGLSHWHDAITVELAQGLSDEVIHMMNTRAPEYPFGAPLPTYIPPHPMAHSVAAPVPNWDCTRSAAAFVVYSWFASIVCAAFEIGSTFLGGLVCKMIAGSIGMFVPWNNVCKMMAAREVEHVG